MKIGLIAFGLIFVGVPLGIGNGRTLLDPGRRAEAARQYQRQVRWMRLGEVSDGVAKFNVPLTSAAGTIFGTAMVVVAGALRASLTLRALG